MRGHQGNPNSLQAWENHRTRNGNACQTVYDAIAASQDGLTSKESNQDSGSVTAFVCSAPSCTEAEHVWDGPTVQVGNAYSVSCSKCGISAFEVDTFMGGF